MCRRGIGTASVLLPLSYWNVSGAAMVRLYLIQNDCLRQRGVQTYHCREWRPLQHSRRDHTMTTPRHTTVATVSSRSHIHSTTGKSERTRSIKRSRALVVVDATEASKRVLRYLGQLAAAG